MKPTANAANIQQAIEDFRFKHNGPSRNKEKVTHDEFDRVSVILEFRNGNSNKLRIWRGRFVAFEAGHLEAAASESYADAIARKAPILKAQHPHRD